MDINAAKWVKSIPVLGGCLTLLKRPIADSLAAGRLSSQGKTVFVLAVWPQNSAWQVTDIQQRLQQGFHNFPYKPTEEPGRPSIKTKHLILWAAKYCLYVWWRYRFKNIKTTTVYSNISVMTWTIAKWERTNFLGGLGWGALWQILTNSLLWPKLLPRKSTNHMLPPKNIQNKTCLLFAPPKKTPFRLLFAFHFANPSSPSEAPGAGDHLRRSEVDLPRWVQKARSSVAPKRANLVLKMKEKVPQKQSPLVPVVFAIWRRSTASSLQSSFGRASKGLVLRFGAFELDFYPKKVSFESLFFMRCFV